MSLLQAKAWRILHIDDDEDDHIIVRTMLKDARGRNIVLDWAATIDEGREKLLSDHYQAVLVDYDLGAGTGIELIREFVQNGYPAPLILLTGRGSTEVDVEAMHAGAALYLTKNEINGLLLERSIRYAIERKQTEARLRLSEEKFSLVFDRSPAPTFLISFEDGLFRDVNQAFLDLSGFTKEEVIGKTSRDLNIFRDPEESGRMREILKETGSLRGIEAIQFTKSGAMRTTSANLDMIEIESEKYILGTSIDITEGKRLEEALQQSLAEADEGRRMLDALMEYVPEEITIAEAPDTNIRMVSRYGQEMLGGSHDQKTVEEVAETLQVERSTLAAAIENLPVGVVMTDAEGNNISMNRSGLKLHGFKSVAEMHSRLEHYYQEYELRELDGRVVPVEEWPASRALRGEFLRDYEVRLLNKVNGEECIVSYTSVPVKNRQGENVLILYTIQDMTERKQAEIELQSAHRQTVEILESISDAFYSLDQDQRFTYINQQAGREWGKNPEDLLGKYIWEVFPTGKDTESYQKMQQALVEKKHIQYESYSAFLDEWVNIHIYPTEQGISVYFQDITERKKQEKALEKNAQDLERSNRDLQEFAYVASHDLREPLRKIESFGGLLLESAPQLNERQISYLERMRSSAVRLSEMVDGLLQLSRINTQGQPFERVDLKNTVTDVLCDLEHQVGRTQGTVEVADNLPVVEGDPLQLRQLLQNLIGNALKYHRPDAPPIIKVYARDISSGIQIVVEDNGIGFKEQEVEKMFQPFQRLVGRAEFEGNGMGLAICRKIVERHGGEITAQGKPGRGSRFVISLPVQRTAESV